ncbi:MAG: SWIM zinc finger family protein [Ilumatobacteraceae bacterium]
MSATAVRPTPEQVLLLAPDRASAAAATSAAVPGAWSAAGCDDEAVWGQYVATSAEPYEVAIDLGAPAFRCTCPSRKVPCKHCLALLLLHAEQRVAPAKRLPFAQQFMQRRTNHPTSRAQVVTPVADGEGTGAVAPDAIGERGSAPHGQSGQREQRRTDRAERMRAGLVELDRWLADRVRTGLAAHELADAATWDRLAARLVDAQCGGLANRVKRVATRIGQHARWHEDVLEEMAVLHALARGALRTSTLPDDLADGVHAATGLTTAKDDVLAGVPSTVHWLVVGHSRTREDRITVQRTWLLALDDQPDSPKRLTWAMLLAFGTFGNDVVVEHAPGTMLHADVHWYPGATPLRALVGRVHEPPVSTLQAPRGQNVGEAMSAAGWAIAAEPWLERYPVCISAVPTPLGNGRWTLADPTGAVSIVPGFWRLGEMIALSGGRPVTIAGEWSADGVLPLTMWADGQAVTL